MPEKYVPLMLEMRPRIFDEVVGQTAVIRIHKLRVQKKRIPSAVMYNGGAGSGKTTTARIMAKAVNCENPQEGNPCLQCTTCLRIEKGEETDVLEIDAASNRGIDSIRRLIDWCGYDSPLNYRVAILDEVHMLTHEASNALLKTLEESASNNVLFVLATTDPQEVPETILSRCQISEFKRLSKQDVGNHLSGLAQRKQVTLDPRVCELIYDRQEGAVRNSIQDLDQLISYADGQPIVEDMFYDVFSIIRRSFFENLFLHLADNQLTAVFQEIDNLRSGIANIKEFLKGMLSVLADLFQMHVSPDLIQVSEESRQRLQILLTKYSPSQVKSIMNTIQNKYMNSYLNSAYLVLRLMLVDIMEVGNLKSKDGHPMDSKIVLTPEMSMILKKFPGAEVATIANTGELSTRPTRVDSSG